MQFRQIHYSLRFDEPDVAFREALKFARLKRASIVTLTETLHARDVIKEDKRWGVVFADDNAILWRKRKWKALKANREVIKILYRRRNGNKVTETGAAVAKLEHRKDGRTLAISAIHPPAGIDRHMRGADALQRNIATDMMLAQAANAAKRHHADYTVLAADYNLDLKDEVVRKRLFRVTGGRVVGIGTLGTHGSRLIDGVVTFGHRVIQRVLKHRPKISDHAPVLIIHNPKKEAKK